MRKKSWHEETAIAVVSFALMTVKLLETFSSSLLQGFVTRRKNIASWSRKRQEQRCQTEIEATNPCHLFFPYPLLFIRRYYCFINNVAINLVYVGGAGVLHSKLNVLLTTACRNRVIRGNG